VRSGESADTGAAVGLSLEGKPEGAPVRLAGDVVVYASEVHRFEPPRGSWAHVSLVVVAVDDDRPLPVERRGRGAGERLQRHVDRARKVLVLELVRREHLEELGTLVAHEPLELVTIDRYWHAYPSLSRSRGPTFLHASRLPVDDRDRPGRGEERNDEI